MSRRLAAYRSARDQKFSGHRFHRDLDGHVFVRVRLDDGSVWLAEIDPNGECISFTEWDQDVDRFYRICTVVRDRRSKNLVESMYMHFNSENGNDGRI